jgi:hypothetical protein
MIILLIFAYFDPKTSVFGVHDFLDHILVLNHLRGTNFNILDPNNKISNIFDGIPIAALGINDLSLEHNLYIIFNPYLAATINESIARIVGFSSVYKIVTILFPMHTYKNKIALFCGFYFGLSPYISSYTYTLAFQALAICCILLILQNQNMRFAWIGLVISTQLSSFAYGGFVLFFIILLILIYHIIAKNKSIINSRRILVVLSIGYLVGLSKTIYLVVFTDFISHRTEWGSINLGRSPLLDLERLTNLVEKILVLNIFGYPDSFPGLFLLLEDRILIRKVPSVILISILIGILWVTYNLAFVQKFKSFKFDNNFLQMRILLICIFTIIIISTIYVMESIGLTHLSETFPIPFQFMRVVTLLSLCWTLVAASVLVLVFRSKNFIASLTINSLILISILQGILTHDGIYGRLHNLIHSSYVISISKKLTISEYYEEEKYLKIKSEFDEIVPKYKVLSLGFDPMVAAFNGFDVVDGYVYNYSLDYKHRFKKIIEPELNRNLAIKEYVDNWGSRLYLFISTDNTSLIQFNWCEANKLGANFLISKLEFDKHPTLNLINKVEDAYLYQIKTDYCSHFTHSDN